jgi:transposase
MTPQDSGPSVGIDVSKKHLDVAQEPRKGPQKGDFRTGNHDTDIARLITRLQKLNPRIILLEATGGYEFQLVAALREAQLPVCCINPLRVRNFARSLGILAKTDKLDARVLARYAHALRPEPRPLPEAQQQELNQLMTRRRQVLKMIQMEKNRLDTAPFPSIQRSILQVLDTLKAQLKDLDRDLKEFVRRDPLWVEDNQLMQSVPGVGPVTSYAALAWLPELGAANRGEVSALVGTAPFNRDSGALRGTRCIQGGRHKMRQALYMATLAALRFNPVIRDFYQRLLQAGKAKKLAITACMRKLLCILNAILKNRQPWNPQMAQTT